MTHSPSPSEPPLDDPQSARDPQAPNRRYLTVGEFSAITGLSLSTLQRLCRKGALPFFQPGGPRTRKVFSPDAIEQARQAQRVAPSQIPHRDGPESIQDTPRGPRPKWLRDSL